MAFCTNCGSQVLDGSKFCENCGAKLEPIMTAAAAVEPVTEPVAAPEPVIPESAQQPQAWEQPAAYSQAPVQQPTYEQPAYTAPPQPEQPAYAPPVQQTAYQQPQQQWTQPAYQQPQQYAPAAGTEEKKESKKPLIIGIVAAAVVAVAALVIVLVSLGKNKTPEPLEGAGTYSLTRVEADGQVYQAAQLDRLGMSGAYLRLDEDGTGAMKLATDEAVSLTWDAGTITAEGETVGYSRTGNTIVLDLDGVQCTFVNLPSGQGTEGF